MILQALCSYYRRASDRLAQLGWIRKPVDFAIVIDGGGNFITVNDLRETRDGKPSGRPTLLPNIGKQAQKHSVSGKDANLLWDDAPFVLGMKGRGMTTTNAFIATMEEFFPDGAYGDDAGIAALKAFCRDQLPHGEVRERIAALLPRKNDEMQPVTVAFRLDGDRDGYFISDRQVVKDRLERHFSQSDCNGFCSITGRRASISRNHTVLKNVWGGQSAGVSLVSFNAAAFTSYNKESGGNAPVGEAAMFAYTTALNSLLESGSNQRMQVGDASTVFWSEEPSRLEELFAVALTEPPKDDPDSNASAIRELFESVETGKRAKGDGNNRFYVLGLSPNAARVAVRFWIVGTVAEMEKNIVRHFKDIRIAHGPRDRDELSLFRLLIQTAAQGKADNIPPNLAGDVMRSIMEGAPYPATALSALVRRTRAERIVNHARAAFLKACINRSPFIEDKKEKELDVSLDLTNTNIGYRLGRLFATLEKTQEEALPGINATIRDRFYGSASSTPASVFPTLIRLSKHHLAKIESKGMRTFLEKLFAEIVGAFSDFPAVLSLSDQGRFAIGYYHQRQDFFTPKKPAADGSAGEQSDEEE